MEWFREEKCIVILTDTERQAKSIYKFVCNLYQPNCNQLNSMKHGRCVIVRVKEGEVELYEKISDRIIKMLQRKTYRKNRE